MWYDFVCILCLCYIGAWLAYLLLTSILKSPADRLRFFKSFKHGVFAWIYPVAIPMFFMARYSGGKSVLHAAFLSLQDTFSVVVLHVDYTVVEPLLEGNDLYPIAFAALLGAVFLNTSFLFFTVLFEKTVNAFRVLWCVHFSRKLFVVVGPLEKNRTILESKRRFDAVLYLGKPTTEEKDWLFVHHVAYRRMEDAEGLARFVRRRFLRLRHWRVILNNATDEENLVMTGKLSQIILKQPSPAFVLENKHGLDVYVFGGYENSDAFYDYVQKTKGRVHYKNRYNMVAYDFERRYPLTAFMDERHLDYTNGVLKNNVNVNVIMIGFGKVNRQLFLASVANNQFVSLNEKKRPYPRRVNYLIYDKEDAEQDKGLNHGYFRYRREILGAKVDKEQYLPLIKEPACTGFRTRNINHKKFYEQLESDLRPTSKRITFNYLVVSFGEDLENYDLAMKLQAKLAEWGFAEETHIFVRIRDHRLSREITQKEKGNSLYCFGDEQSAVYDLHGIVNEKNECMARHRHYTYTAEFNPKASERRLAELAGEEWYQSYNEAQRASNIYGCLNLRFKLNLLGFDYMPIREAKRRGIVPKETKRERGGFVAETPLPQEDYYQKYERNAPIDYSENRVVEGKRIITYLNARMKPGSPRYNLAVQEHARWNAYMITCGYIPAPLSTLKTHRGRIHEERKHCNITTMEGLIRYRKEMQKHRPEKTEEDLDVIRYDYHLMDDAAWLLAAGEMVIVPREALKKEVEKKPSLLSKLLKKIKK